MDQVAIISDIHGNIPALEAVLDDICKRGIPTICCLGDLVGKGPHSDLAVDICREVCDVVVRGNWDEHITGETDNPTLQWHQARLGAARLDYLRDLPNSFDLRMSGKRIRLFHASQESVHKRVYAYPPDDAYNTHLRMFQNTAFTGHDCPEPDIVGYGDIHVTFLLPLFMQNKLLFNVGSVGNPLDMPLAAYTILHGTMNSDDPGDFSIEFVRLRYDIELAIVQAQELNMPELDDYAVELRSAIYRGRRV